MYRSMLTLAAMSLMAFPLMGCSHGGDADSGADSGDANVASSTPAIHVRQTMVLLDNGQPKVERNYRQMLADCQKGPGPLKPLDEDVAKKLGRTYLESWYEGARMAVKADRWDFTAREAPDTCQFVPIHKSQLTIIAAGSDITADLIAGTAMRQPSEGVVRHAATAETSDDKDLKAAVAVKLASQGQGNLMGQASGESRDAGQICARNNDPAFGESCVWSGGKQWGFVTDKADTSDRMDAPTDSILLWSKPTGGNGLQWTTQQMTVGQGFDDNVFDVPSGIAVKAAN
jgi:hypothetical protein